MKDEKILQDEKLSENELEKVAGGRAGETANDSCFLNSLNGSTNRYGDAKIAFSAGYYNDEIKRGWATVGIEADVSCGPGGFGYENKYYFNGRRITQEKARQIAMEVTGHYMKESDWKW